MHDLLSEPAIGSHHSQSRISAHRPEPDPRGNKRLPRPDPVTLNALDTYAGVLMEGEAACLQIQVTASLPCISFPDPPAFL